ncbi:V-type ATP synthase subunit D [bacterium]|nr:V-type ATP synthase subunit D [bacterium]
MKLRVNPNRMQLMRLKKRLSFATRGHKLLKDKQEDLMHRFMDLTKDAVTLRRRVEAELIKVYRAFLSARMDSSREDIARALDFPKIKGALEISYENIMNLRIPSFTMPELTQKDPELPSLHADKMISHGFFSTVSDLDYSIDLLSKIMPDLLKMVSLENKIKVMAAELETTRRRVNALEYNLIPALNETVRFITNRLNEMERSNITRLMKVKDIVRAH